MQKQKQLSLQLHQTHCGRHLTATGVSGLRKETAAIRFDCVPDVPHREVCHAVCGHDTSLLAWLPQRLQQLL
jgi:hypothetical protein